MTAWVDTHCHVHMSDLEPGRLLDRAREAGVGWVVCPGTDAAGSATALRLADAFPGRVLASAGLHPHEASRWRMERDSITELAGAAHAVGECGLDYYRDLSPRADQRVAFRGQLELAVELDQPVIVHCRDAFADAFDAIEESEAGPLTVMHCWTGGPRWTRRLLGLGVTFSFAGPIAFPTGDTVRRGAAEAPPERTMVETDTPFLAPPPHRGERNEPANLPLVGGALADVWGMDVGEVAGITSANAERVFRRG